MDFKKNFLKFLLLIFTLSKQKNKNVVVFFSKICYDNSMKTKQKKWIKFRHTVARNILYALLYPYAKIKYGLDVTKFKNPEKRAYLIVSNHQTGFDQFFVGMCFPSHIYYVATEDIFSLGFASELIKYLVAPIPIKKSMADVRAVMNCMKVAKEGGSIWVAPEGNRTFSGKTETISPAIASLAKTLKLPVAILRIEGGYGVHPRWADKVRKGKIKVYVSEVIEPEEVKALSKDELFKRIADGIMVDETKIEEHYTGKHLAEYLDRVFYVCPDCGLSSFLSDGDYVSCRDCGRAVRYLPNKRLSNSPFHNAKEWYEYQENFIHNLDLNSFGNTCIYTDVVKLSEVILYKRKKPISNHASISLFKDRFEIIARRKKYVIPFDEITAVSVLGKNKMNIYFGEKGETLWQIKGDKHFNPIKYMNIYYHDQNVKKGETEHEFLGL